MKRTLSLKRETLASLSDDDLAVVLGGDQYSVAGFTCPLLGCQIFSNQLTCRGCVSISVCV